VKLAGNSRVDKCGAEACATKSNTLNRGARCVYL
jgi:hypothetical protein